MEYINSYMVTPKKDFLDKLKDSLILAGLFDAFRLAIILTVLYSVIVMGHYFIVENQHEKQLENEITNLSVFYKSHNLSKLVAEIERKNASATDFKYQLLNQQGKMLAGKSVEKKFSYKHSIAYNKITRTLANNEILIIQMHKSTDIFKKITSSILNFLLITLLVLTGLTLADLYFQRHTYD